MDGEKIGNLIKKLRSEKNLTQKQLSAMLNLSDKTVSKWERGVGLPDISVISLLAEILCVSTDSLLSGDVDENTIYGGNMKNSVIYVCPVCGNLSVCTGEAEVTCCGRKSEPLTPKKAEGVHDLTVEMVEDEWYLTSNHPMEKEHYLSFVAFLTSEQINIIKQYPEWNFECRFKRRGHGKLLFYCNKHGLFYKNI